MDWLRRRLGWRRLEPFSIYQFKPLPRDGYLVGGALRDALLGRSYADIDWIVPDPEAAARRAADTVGGSVFALDETRGHWRVVTNDGSGVVRDYAPLEGPVETNLWRRDYTVNALAATLDGTLIDPTGGERDLRAGRLRMTQRSALSEDTLRPLRGVRLRAQLGFRLEPATRAAIVAEARAQQRGERERPAWERVSEELNKLLNTPDAARGIADLTELGLSAVYLPELMPLRGVPQGGLHHLDVFDHSVEALRQLLLGFPDATLGLRWATLFHDVGKPATRTYDSERGRYTFYGHDKLGGEITAKVLRRLCQPGERVRHASRLVRYHMLPLPNTHREVRRFVYKRYDLLPDLLSLMLADREAARGPRASTAAREVYRAAVSRVLEFMKASPPRKPLLDGREVMAVLGTGPGPHIGAALAFLREAEAVDDIHNRAEAVEAVRHYAKQQGWLDEASDEDEEGSSPQDE
ncbi:MAG: HDIG domain-containing protein [Trueperaceae bacterium]|nr:HDIG domain-containing protein [Trueperaceae bacterium]